MKPTEIQRAKLLLLRAALEISYMHSAETLEMVHSAEGESIVDEGMELLGLKDLSDEEIRRARAQIIAEHAPEPTWEISDEKLRGMIPGWFDQESGWNADTVMAFVRIVLKEMPRCPT